MADPIEVFYWPTPNGHKITIACEEMGLAYKVTPVNVGRGDQFKPDFLAIAPNNRMPAIVDPDGPGGEPITVFESGAILQYLGRKTAKFYPPDERARVKVDEWVHWQMANLGPNAGQRNHFRSYAPAFVFDQRHIAYGAIRYTNEVHRLYGVLNEQLKGREYITGDYSIADMLCWPWIQPASDGAIQLEDFPHLTAWKARVGAREAVGRAMALGEEVRLKSSLGEGVRTGAALADPGKEGDEARKILFGQRAR